MTEKKAEVNQVSIKDFKEIETLRFQDTTYFKNCFLLKLETTDESLIGKIEQIEVFEDYVYILDSKTSRILIFDKNGKYLSDVGEEGQGPEEYISISGFYVNPYDKSVNIIDPMEMSIDKHSLSGKFIRKIKHKNRNLSFMRRLIMINENEIFCYSGSNWEENSLFSIVDASDFSLKRNIYSYPYKSDAYISYAISSTPFSFNDERIIFSIPFSNELLSYRDEKIEPYLHIYNKEEINAKLLSKKLEEKEGDYFSVISQIINENIYNAGILNVFENNHFVLCDFRKENSQMGAILWNKKENKGVYIKNYSTWTPDLSLMKVSYGNTVVRVWENTSIDVFKRNTSEDNELKNQYPNELFEIIMNYNEEEDNPILIFYEFKTIEN